MKRFLVLPLVIILALGFVLPMATQVRADTYYVNGGESIQNAIDGASSGDIIILDGTFSNYSTVTVGTSGITIKSASHYSGILDGGDGPAFRLVDGLSNVTFEGLVIKNRTGWRGGGIEAWDMTTSNINVRNNQFLDNEYNGILVGSEGGFVHSNWMVKGNTASGNGFAGIELTNAQNSTIIQNDLDGNMIGVIVQARNTVADSGAVYIDGVSVQHNTISDSAWYGAYVLSFTGHATLFTPISGASSLLTSTGVSNNAMTDSGIAAIIFWAYNDAAMARNGRINHNVINSLPDTPGIRVLERGQSGQQGTVQNVKIVNNTFDSDTNPEITDEGEETKIPPGPF